MERDYFTAYSDLEVHEHMLNDRNRNAAYKDAILTNEEYFKNKVVLDVGAGTGILSVMCAKAGARKVYSVEASEIFHVLQDVVKENDVEDIVETIAGKIEEIKIPEKVDVIISEWMGFYLLHEGMLDSVLFARDKFLHEDGVLFPEMSAVFVAPCRIPSLFSYWEDVDGVSMKTFGGKLRKSYHRKPKVMDVSPDDIIGDADCVVEFYLKYLTIEDLDIIKSTFHSVSRADYKYQGLCLWFTVAFPTLCEQSTQVVLSTAPNSDSTHWKQTVIILQDDIEVEEGTLITGNLTMTRDSVNPRFYNIEFEGLNPNEEEHPIPCNCYDTKCRIIKSLSDQYDERDMDINGVD